MPDFNVDLTLLSAIWMGGSVLLVPLAGLTARFGIAPLLDSGARVRTAGRRGGAALDTRFEALEQRRAQREIRADMDGTVTYIRRVKDGERSVEGASFLRIADMTHSVFMASTVRWDLFFPGEYVTITSGRVEYEAMVTAPETLQLEAVTDPDSSKRNVYFSLTAPAPELEDGDTGSTVLVLEKREDTLYLDKKAVHTVNGEHVVYYQDPQTGIRTFKTVETGLETAREIEIVGGLQEGESVILK